MMQNQNDFSLLMLEDDVEDRYITESTFALKGYDIKLNFLSQASQVLPYLSSCGKDNGIKYPDLILLDKYLPIESGFDALRDIKSHPVYKKIPVVMVSGTSYQHDVDRAYEMGVNSFIEKPFNDELTVKRIQLFIEYWFQTVALPIVKLP